ncbi:putative naringenin-chalcone synthase [Microbacterium sp. AK009]|uniref:type III polyketide synthase n=1 Tax=Microbacterium sp. AK009 TaxID=2723068 RepID=UPI0015C759DC|nr:type III polyketide synthase [Microbacterium sp. AK009]NYF17919.1 putative naringenin-chalcone synthase [Microbacterium sp. AK009]
MVARILSIGTAVPPTVLAQGDVRDFFVAQPGVDRLTARLIGAAFDAAAIDRRHTVLHEFGRLRGEKGTDAASAAPGGGFIGAEGELRVPSTGARNAAYTALAPELYAQAACEALAGGRVAASDITHVVTVSCTGFFAPGPDYRLVRDLGLASTVERYHLGFIGCAAGIPALRAAARISAADPDAVVLVACAELCSLHIRASDDPQQIVAASVFADGAAAAVVTARDDLAGRVTGAVLDLDRFATTLTSEGETDMVWTIGDEGFEMTLSAEVPRIIGREIQEAVGEFLGDDRPATWAVHPGGRSVLDRVESGLGLPESALETSRDVLREFGNMSSATILFILQRVLGSVLGDGERIAALAFGPGLTVEAALLTARTGGRP